MRPVDLRAEVAERQEDQDERGEEEDRTREERSGAGRRRGAAGSAVGLWHEGAILGFARRRYTLAVSAQPEPSTPGPRTPPRELPEGYRFERTTVRNVHLLVPLFREVFGREVTEEFLLRKYTTPWTKDGVFHGYLVLDAAGRAVAHHTGIPCRFRFGDRLVLAAQSCDTMTAAELQGKGVFTLLGKKVDRLLVEEGFEFIFGFANDVTVVAAPKKLGWKPLGVLSGYRLPVRTLPVERLCRRLRFPYRAYLALVDRAFASFRVDEPVPSSCVDAGHGGVERDEAFYGYRRFTFNRRVRLAGVAAWFKVDAGLTLGEVGPCTEEELLSMLRALRRRCFWLGIDVVWFHASPGTRAESLFSRHFPRFQSWTTFYGDFTSAVDVATVRLTSGDIDSF